MFEKIKDLYNLQKDAKTMQARLAAQQVTGSARNRDVSISINGNQDVLAVTVAEDTEFSKDNLERAIKEALTDAQAKLKKNLVESFKDLM